MTQLSDNLKTLLRNRVQQSELILTETREWVDKFKNAGFNVADLEAKQAVQEAELTRLRMLL